MRVRSVFLAAAVTITLLAQLGSSDAARRVVDKRAPIVRSDFGDKTMVFSSNMAAGGADLTQYGSTRMTGTVTDDNTGVASLTLVFTRCEPADFGATSASCTRGATVGVSAVPCGKGCVARVSLGCNKTRRTCWWFPPMADRA